MCIRDRDTTSDVEEQKEMLRRNHDQLIGRTVTVTDILSSIILFDCLALGDMNHFKHLYDVFRLRTTYHGHKCTCLLYTSRCV